MNPLETYLLDCPWCGELIEIQIDLSAGDQSYIEDCQICCAPILVDVQLSAEQDLLPQVSLRREGGD